jgi:outer membrane protein assembly factor BamB
VHGRTVLRVERAARPFRAECVRSARGPNTAGEGGLTILRAVWRVAAVATAVSLTMFIGAPIPAADAVATCSQAEVGGGEWPQFGRDSFNSRHQQAENGIGVLEAATLEPVWHYRTPGSGNLPYGALSGTPIIANGCAYIVSASGDVTALNADTGALVWQKHIDVPNPGLGGALVSSPVAAGNKLVVLVNQLGKPYAIAFNAQTGARLWKSAALFARGGFYTNATPVVTGGIVLAGFSPAEGDARARGGLALINLATGLITKRIWTIPDNAFANGFAGGGVWTAPAIDDAGYAYYGTSNPYSKHKEHAFTNAILKADVKPGRATFGKIVGSYKGNIDQFLEVLRDAVEPLCDLLGDHPALQIPFGDSMIACLQLDLDFGAPPNLFTDASGRLLVGDLQKSGVFHVADTSNMNGVWRSVAGLSCAVCNADAGAWDHNGSLYTVGTPGGLMWSFDTTTGASNWLSLVVDAIHYQSVSVANGVAYTVDTAGFLSAFDTATGLPILKRSIPLDTQSLAVGASSNGVSIARHRVYVEVGSQLVAYESRH